MVTRILCFGLTFIFFYYDVAFTQDQCDASGCRLSREGSYFVVAPRKIKPNQVVQVSVSINKLYYPQLHVRTAIRRNDEEVVSAIRTFHNEGHAIVQLKIPGNAMPGNYTMRVDAQEMEGVAGYVFENVTDLIFDTKQVSCFIQLNKPFYMQGQDVHFRIMPVEHNLMSRSGSMDVSVVDATQTVVRHWKSQQTNAGGVLAMTFTLSDQPAYGQWKIRVDTFGHQYEKHFDVNEFWVTAIDVNVSMPLYHTVDEFGIGGVIMANLSLGQPSQGTCKVTAEIRLPPGDREPGDDGVRGTIEKETRYFPGVTDFMFSMEEIAVALGSTEERPISPANYEVYVEAEVYDWYWKQPATGGAITVIYAEDVMLQLLGDSSRTFKPHRPLHIYFALVHQDGTPLHYFRRQVTINRSVRTKSQQTFTDETKLITPDDGIVRYTWVPGTNDQFATITAYYDDQVSRITQLTAYRHFSPTDSYIYVTTSTDTPTVDNYMVFTVTTNTYVEKINYLVTCGGNIITGDTFDMYSHQKTFSLSLSRDMIPEAHLIVWHIFKGEVIADSLNFFVNGTRLNSIDMNFNRGKDFSGDTVEVTGRTDPSSFIGAAAVDYELYAYGWNPFITETDIIRELRTFDYHVNTSYTHTWKLPDEQEHMIHYPAPTFGVDANTTFEYSGLVAFTDANVTRIPHPCNWTLGQFPCMDGGCYNIDEWCNGVKECEDGQDEMGCPRRDLQERFTPPRNRLGLLTRHYMMVGEWVWGGHFVMPNGRIDVIVNVPDEPMAWVMSGFAISKDLGFGIVHDPVRHQATRSFYMRAEMPGSAVKGEQIGIRIGLFNYWEQDLECIVQLHDSDDYRFVVVESFGIVSSYNPRTIRGNIQTMVFLERGGVYELHIPILPIKDGCISVTVSARTFLLNDVETLEVCTKYDGVTNYLHTPYFVDLINSGSMVLPDLEIPVPDQFVKPEERKHLYVPGSPNATVSIVGDVVGPGFYYDYLDAENTLRKPYGGAEQNMYNFAYNLYNLLYLKATNQLDNNVLVKALEGLQLGLQRQMSYMTMDGSFQMFRDYLTDTPSTWVSAFSLRTLNDANQKDWENEYFFIPSELLNRITLWLCTKQLPSGAFVEEAPLYDRKLRFNYNEDGTPNTVAITSYVLITLSEVSGLTGEAEICKDSAKSLARTYLEPLVESIEDVYQMAIMTYALQAANSNKRSDAWTRLDAMKRTDNNVYWADKPVPANDIRMIDTLPYHQPRRWYDNEAYAVEATSYAMLTVLRVNTTGATPISNFLQSMRNTYFAQASTQDSIMALRALYEYAKQDTNRDLYNIEFTIAATSMGGNWSSVVHILRDNWPNMQTVNIHPVWGSVRGNVRGTGKALWQLSTEVNVEYPEQILPAAEEHYFDIEIHNVYEGRNFSIMHSTACAKWSRPDISNHSGLAVMEVHVPSGYVITNDVLRAYAQSGEVPTMHRAEAYGRKVVFYFDYLNEEPTCVNYRLDRWFPIANMTIQHLLRVYDYYEPGMHNTTLYTTFSLFNLHICQVCGSFQCPYCPFYNPAPSLQASCVFSFIIVLVGYIITSKLFRYT